MFGPFTKTEIEECFNAFDLDGNGFLCASELRKVYQFIGESCTDDDIDEIISMMDDDGDGQISFKEFFNLIFKHSGPPKKELYIKKKNDNKQIQESFTCYIILFILVL